MATDRTALRRGLPRRPGGEPWPPVEGAPAPASAPAPVVRPVPTGAAPDPIGPDAAGPVVARRDPAPPTGAPASAPASAPAAAAAAAAAPGMSAGGASLRRGLPRTAGGEPWPPAGVAHGGIAHSGAATAEPPLEKTPPAAPAAPPAAAPTPSHAAVPAAVATPDAAEAAALPGATTDAGIASDTAAADPAQIVTAPERAPRTALAPQAAPQESRPESGAAATPARSPRMIGSRTAGQWARLGALWVLGALCAAGIVVLAARGVTTLPGVPEFLRRYPGEYEPAVHTSDGFPAWARWSHFLNFFFMVLIVRSGLLVRHQQKPPAFFASKRGGKKISIHLWLHTSIDVLWLLNGLAFVVLLFASGHWVRIVPTSWEVFPNAASALLQYVTLEWPTENGWSNYNSLQQLMYFAVVFIAAPLAAISGVRMSQWWPQNAERLDRAFPAPVARAIHYPVMLFFVLFVIVHVFLVLATGALRNLNHMFAGTDETSWVGFLWFAGGLLLTAAVTWAARPLVLAPIASLFGRVSER